MIDLERSKVKFALNELIYSLFHVRLVSDSIHAELAILLFLRKKCFSTESYMLRVNGQSEEMVAIETKEIIKEN